MSTDGKRPPGQSSAERYPEGCPEVSFDRLPPVAVVTLYGHLTHTTDYATYPNVAGTPWENSPLDFPSQLDAYTAGLPSRNLERAREVFGAFVESDQAANRQYIAPHLPYLFEHDKELGTDLWKKLLGDKEPGVRLTAYRHLEVVLEEAGEAIGRRVRECSPAEMLKLISDDELILHHGMAIDDFRELFEYSDQLEEAYRELGLRALRMIEDTLPTKKN